MQNIKREVFEANLALVKHNLVIFTWGNVSARTKDNLVVIKPSGVDYTTMKAEDMVVVDLEGNIVEGKLKPSSDMPTHIELYKAFPEIYGICHTHSDYATSFAQAGKSLECLGTTHADYFYGTIPCTRSLIESEITKEYEKNTGKVIVETFKEKDYYSTPGVLVQHHGVFSWGSSAINSVHNAVIIETLAKMNFQTILLNPSIFSISKFLLDKHHNRKHGANKYYGQ